MPIYVSGISLPFEAPPQEALERAEKTVGNPTGATCAVAKRAVDARRKHDIRFVYTVAVTLESVEQERALAARCASNTAVYREQPALELPMGAQKLQSPPVVAGFGPAGMFAGLLLARAGFCPVVLERGADADTRSKAVEDFWRTGRLDGNANVQFGEGGAGTFSDGKLVTRIGDPRCSYVLNELCRHGAPEEILVQAKPHVGTDLLRGIVKSIRREIISLGGQVLFGNRLAGLTMRGGTLAGVQAGTGTLAAQALVLAPGHSARDVFQMLLDSGGQLQAKPFSVGVRVEHLQADIDRALYGGKAGHPLLPTGEYQLSHRSGGRGVYTFCMCPGGLVVPAASGQGELVTNGMSLHARDGKNANAALVVSVDSGDFGGEPLSGVSFQQGLEQAAFRMGGGNWRAPAQTAGLFKAGKAGLAPGRVEPSYALGTEGADLAALFPEPVTNLLREGLHRFGRKLPGFDGDDTVLTGVETRTSSPLRVARGESLEAVGLPGVYPCGEGPGYAGGIVSAAVDGIRVAQAIMARYAPPKG